MTNAERIRPMTNEELVQALRNCSPVDGECINEVVRLAADRLEALTGQLHYAQAERDVATKRMIALEIEKAPKEGTE